MTAALRFMESPVTTLAMALRKAVRITAFDTRINPCARLAPALPVA
jgi:hypothetical protein